MRPLCRPPDGCASRLVLALLLAGCAAPASDPEGGDGVEPGAVEPAPDLRSTAASDEDHDGYTIAAGDCDDHDPTVHPGAPEICFDHIDQDCDGVADQTCDDDHDGSSIAEGDCNDGDPLVGPFAMEVWGNLVDDNCNGVVDEIPPPCDQHDSVDPADLAGAVELCAPWVQKSSVNPDSDERARGVMREFGLYRPHAGRNLVVLSTGIAAAAADARFVLPQPGTEFPNNAKNPLPMPNANGCGAGPDEPTVHDYVEWSLTIRVPQNARSFHFDFMFATAEYPEWLCSQYNDKFLAILDSKAYKGNVSFDAKGHPVTVNIGFFDVCESVPMNQCTRPISKLAGTGYERFDFADRPIGGGTDWLRTTAPVVPGETIELRFILFDEGDHRFDSTVLIDNLQFELDAAQAPITIG